MYATAAPLVLDSGLTRARAFPHLTIDTPPPVSRLQQSFVRAFGRMGYGHIVVVISS
jgi:hypothetical protein